MYQTLSETAEFCKRHCRKVWFLFSVHSSAISAFQNDCSAVDLRGCQHFWLAGHRVDQSSISPFVWMVPSKQGCDSDVSAIRFSNWAPNQPDNAGDEHVVREACLAMVNSTSSAWYDVDCAERICAICEYHDRPNDDSGTEFEHHLYLSLIHI